MNLKTITFTALLGTIIATPALAGDAAKGKTLYTSCAACHGQKAEGVEAMGAPKLAGQSPWYLVTQIKNFQTGVRGTHKDDTFGKMMAPMANMLTTEKDIQDVVAYIGTL